MCAYSVDGSETQANICLQWLNGVVKYSTILMHIVSCPISVQINVSTYNKTK